MASAASTLFIATILGVFISNASLASATPSDAFTNNLFGTPNATGGPVEEIKCYALPYGAIGMYSHLLTFWTFAWMAVGKTPLWPFFNMKTYKFDVFLACLSLCTCIPIASITMHRCRLSWHFLLICIWKLITSVSLACTTLHRCWIVRQEAIQSKKKRDTEQDHRGVYQRTPNQEADVNGIYAQKNRSEMFSDNQEKKEKSEKRLGPLWWLSLHLAGTIIGMVGLLPLLWASYTKDATIRHLTYGFGAVLAIIPILVGIFWYVHHLDKPDSDFLSAFGQTIYGAFVAFVAVFGVFSSLYSDLVLGSIANNLFGAPSNDFASLYWAWFIAKRLPLLSL